LFQVSSARRNMGKSTKSLRREGGGIFEGKSSPTYGQTKKRAAKNGASELSHPEWVGRKERIVMATMGGQTGKERPGFKHLVVGEKKGIVHGNPVDSEF